ncbi:hypothetical protein MLD38_001566 [Melastoma candidum]|uniref:Uncharacterized protein n=1 Tax=Melastoma candidum TaxID=119954 RepID=A0ACB9SEN1_9MYRT|nr:hypothetical protein MLD38_001566 [Melastoma candidum]
MAKWILAKLDVKRLLETSHTFVIADLGCSVGPNTFFVVQNIVETVIEKCSGCGIDIEGLEFQAFLNDKITNDFNTLFRSLPSEKPYHVAAVPGSFHGRLFPKASLHLIHSSYSIQWLSQVPSQVLDDFCGLEQGQDLHRGCPQGRDRGIQATVHKGYGGIPGCESG